MKAVKIDFVYSHEKPFLYNTMSLSLTNKLPVQKTSAYFGLVREGWLLSGFEGAPRVLE